MWYGLYFIGLNIDKPLVCVISFFTRRTKVQKSVEYQCASLWNALESKQRETFDTIQFSNGMRDKYDRILKTLVQI